MEGWSRFEKDIEACREAMEGWPRSLQADLACRVAMEGWSRLPKAVEACRVQTVVWSRSMQASEAFWTRTVDSGISRLKPHVGLLHLGVAMNVAGVRRSADPSGRAISNIFTWFRKWKTRRIR